MRRAVAATAVAAKGIAVDPIDNVWLSDARFLYQYSEGGAMLRQFIISDGGHIAPDNNGEVYIINTEASMVDVYLHNGTHIRTIGKGRLNGARDIAVDGRGLVYIVDDSDITLVLQATGKYANGFRSLDSGNCVAIGSDGRLYVGGQKCVWVHCKGKEEVEVAVVNNLQALALDRDGNLLVCSDNEIAVFKAKDEKYARITKFAHFLRIGPTLPGRHWPYHRSTALCMSVSPTSGKIYIASKHSRDVHVFGFDADD